MNRPQQTPPDPPQKPRLLDNRAAIFVMLFCVTGFLGIPVLCASRGFTRTEKLVWSVVVTLYTCVLIAITAAIVWWSYTSIRDALQ